MKHELIGADVLVTDVANNGCRIMGMYTIKEVKDDGEMIFTGDGGNAWCANDDEFKKFQEGEVAWVHPDEVIIELILE